MKKAKKYRLFALGLFILSCMTMATAQPCQEMSSTSMMLPLCNNSSYCTRNVTAVMSTGSAYSTTVETPGISYAAQSPSGPRRVTEHPTIPFADPIGDAALPLALMACAYLILRTARKHKSAMSK